MPLIVFCGIPASGKTTRAQQLKQHLESLGKTVELVNEESLLINKDEGYQNSLFEKQTRGKLKANVERRVSKDTIVIADSLNYIKGYRYELFCVSKAANTQHCVVYCDTPVSVAKEWNRQRPAEQQFQNETLLEELSMRMEVPNAQARWDKPLFAIRHNEETPIDAITEFITAGKALKPGMSTRPQKLSETNYMYELDKITNEIVSAIMKAQASTAPGEEIAVPHTTEKVSFNTRVSIVKLRSVRTQFVRLTQMQPPSSKEEIARLFVLFLRQNVENV